VRISRTFSFYVGRQFLFWFLGIVLLLTSLVFLFDLVEMFRRTAKHEDATVAVVMGMTALRIPFMIEQIAPFGVLFGALFTFWRLNRNHELVIVRAAGVSAWLFTLPILAIAFAIGVAKVTAFNPLASSLLLQYEQMEARFIRGSSSLASLSRDGIWLRQETETGHYVLHADEVRPNRMELAKVIVFEWAGKDVFDRRIDAATATLTDGYWILGDAAISTDTGVPRRVDRFSLFTNLTPENIYDSFAPPETLSFWELPHFIAILENAGFSGIRHRIHLQALLADPVLLVSLALLAAIFSLRLQRRGGTMVMIAAAVVSGFLVFFLTDVVHALGMSASVPIPLAAWSPAVVTLLIGASMVFHLEDG
jgi:lipopolysaccharide export system permease protein